MLKAVIIVCINLKRKVEDVADNKTINVKKTIEEYIDRSDWRVKANANQSYSVGGMILNTVGKVVANYWLNEVYPAEAGELHRNGDIHIHDLDFLGGYCCGHSLRALLREGFNGVPGKVSANPPKHLSAALGQMVNFLGTMQNEWAGAQAFSSFDTFLAPYVKHDGLSYEEVKQLIQEFVFNCGTPSRWGGQTVFSNITLDIKCPEDLKDKEVFIGGEDTGTTYKDYQNEMDIINLTLLDVLSEGDKDGRPFTFPIPTYNITNDWDWDSPVANKIFEVTAKYGYPYFSNYISSDMKPSDVRSMAFIGSQDIIYKDKFGRVSKNELRHLVNNWYNAKEGNKPQYQFLMDGKFVDVTEMFKIPYKDYGEYVEVTLDNGYVERFSIDHKCAVITPESIETKLSQELKAGDKFLLSSKPWNCSDIGTYETGKILGYYLAEGWKRNNEIFFAININHKEIVDEIVEFFSKLGSRTTVEKQEDVNIFTVHVYGKTGLGLINTYIMGERATAKRLLCNVWDMSNDFRQGMLDGYVATDGSIKYGSIAHTTNKELIQDLKYLGSSVGKIFKESVNEKNTRYFKEDKSDLETFTSYKLDVYSCEQSDKGYHVPVKSVRLVKSKAEFVYNFTVNTPEHLVQLPDGVISHQCCRLRLDLRELLKKGNGLFGSAEQTGSIGVVTLNMARLGYLFKGDKEGLLSAVSHLCNVAKDTLEVKREFITARLEDGLYPYTKRWIGTYRNFFSTIGVNGMNEMIRNFTNDEHDITDEWGQDFADDVLVFIRDLMVQYQKDTGHLYNLEATPAEGATTRFARADKALYPDIIQAGTEDTPYYTNSSQLPTGFTDDPFTALDLQDRLQTRYTGGTVLHLYMGSKISSAELCKKFVKVVLTNYNLPYISITPVYSICPKHGYIAGEHKFCPICAHELAAAKLIRENQ